jgi:hypothetical protein
MYGNNIIYGMEICQRNQTFCRKPTCTTKDCI